MEALRYNSEVSENGDVDIHLHLEEFRGRKVIFYILPIDEESEDRAKKEQEAFYHLQQQNNFYKEVIGSEEEDIWNDLL